MVGLPVLVTVYSGSSLPSGRPIWSVPVSSSMFPTIAIPAVPSASGADLLALDDHKLRALASDGSTVWEVGVGRDSSSQVIPDFSGSALVTEPFMFEGSSGGWVSTHILQGVNPSNLQLTTLYTFTAPDSGATHTVIPHPSGVLSILDAPPAGPYYWEGCLNPSTGGSGECQVTVTVLSPSTGQAIASIPLENSTWVDNTGGQVFGTLSGAEPPTFGGMIVAGDGNAYLSYAYYNASADVSGSGAIEQQSVTYLMLLRVSPDGTFAKIQLDMGTYNSTNPPPWSPTTCSATGSFLWGSGPAVITNAGTGAAVFATVYQYPGGDCSPSAAPAYSRQISYVSQSGLGSQVNAAANTFVPALQREDGSYIGTDGYNNVIALGLDGNVIWQQALPSVLTPLYATADGGAIVTSTTQCTHNIVTDTPCSPQLGTLYTVDQNGNVTSQTPDPGVVYSWTGGLYDPSARVSAVPGLLPIDPAASFCAFASGGGPGGNPSLTHVMVRNLLAKMFVPSTMDTVSSDQDWEQHIRTYSGLPKSSLDFKMYYDPHNQPTENAFLTVVGTTTNSIIGYIDHGYLSASDFTTALGICFTDTCLVSSAMLGLNQSGGTGPAIVLPSPISGPVGTRVSIAGTNFGTAQPSSTVSFNGVQAAIVSWAPNQIVATVPTGATSGNIVVSVNGVNSNGYPFAVTSRSSLSLTFDTRDSLTVKARVLFLAMCGFTDAFKSFWNMTSTPHVLVYPSYKPGNPGRRLYEGYARWDFDQFLYGMASGNPVSYSVGLANQSANYYREQLTWGFIGEDFYFLPTH